MTHERFFCLGSQTRISGRPVKGFSQLFKTLREPDATRPSQKFPPSAPRRPTGLGWPSPTHERGTCAHYGPTRGRFAATPRRPPTTPPPVPSPWVARPSQRYRYGNFHRMNFCLKKSPIRTLQKTTSQVTEQHDAWSASR